MLSANRLATDSEAAIERWMQDNSAALERCLRMLADIKTARRYDTTTLPVALREIRNLIRGGSDSAGRHGRRVVHDGRLNRLGRVARLR